MIRPNQQNELQERLAQCAAGGVEAINARLDKIEQEWSTGRVIKAMTGLAIVAGFALTIWVDPRWLVLPAIAGVFLLQYFFFRISPLAELFQSFGLRTGQAIDEERVLLRTLRGDFANLPTVAHVEDKEAVCRLEDEGGSIVPETEERYGPREVAVLIATAAR